MQVTCDVELIVGKIRYDKVTTRIRVITAHYLLSFDILPLHFLRFALTKCILRCQQA